MTDRYERIGKYRGLAIKERLKYGPVMKDRHRLALSNLARGEARIIGLARRTAIRDYAIAGLRAVTLLGAVLIPTLKSDGPDPSDEQDRLPISLSVNSVAPPSAQSPAEVNLDLDVAAAGAGGAAETRFEIYGHRPVFVGSDKKLTLGVAMPSKYWYRTELGVGDVFWALPDGDFYFEMKGFDGCAVLPADAQCDVTLELAFNAGATTEINRLSLDAGAMPVVLDPDNSQIKCEPGASASYEGSDRGSYIPQNCRFNNLMVSLRRPEPSRRQAANDKVALDVRWCEISETCHPAAMD